MAISINTFMKYKKEGRKFATLTAYDASLAIPVIGIGAGADTDGQILVRQDILGLTAKPPKFSHNFLQAADGISAAVKAYVTAVQLQQFPTPQHSF